MEGLSALICQLPMFPRRELWEKLLALGLETLQLWVPLGGDPTAVSGSWKFLLPKRFGAEGGED